MLMINMTVYMCCLLSASIGLFVFKFVLFGFASCTTVIPPPLFAALIGHVVHAQSPG